MRSKRVSAYRDAATEIGGSRRMMRLATRPGGALGEMSASDAIESRSGPRKFGRDAVMTV
jgi:hypothetical protein